MNSFVSCRTQYENLGDLIINKMLIDELSYYGNVYLDIYGVPSKFANPLLENLNIINTESLNFSNKGGRRSIIEQFSFFRRNNIKLVTSSPGPIYPQNIDSPLWEFTQFSRRINKLFGTHFYNIGNCCSHLIFGNTAYVGTITDGYYLRSSESVSYLQQYIDSQKVHFIPDLCFLMHYRTQKTVKKNIALLDIRIVEGCNAATFEWCKRIVDSLIAQGFNVILYHQVEKDKQVMVRLYEYLGNPKVSVRDDIVWYEDLTFFADKMFVISNRLHSLLLGAAFGAFPLCLFEETPLTAKLKHIWNSSFSASLPTFLENAELPTLAYNDLFNQYSDSFQEEFEKNANICRETIKTIIAQND